MIIKIFYSNTHLRLRRRRRYTQHVATATVLRSWQQATAEAARTNPVAIIIWEMEWTGHAWSRLMPWSLSPSAYNCSPRRLPRRIGSLSWGTNGSFQHMLLLRTDNSFSSHRQGRQCYCRPRTSRMQSTPPPLLYQPYKPDPSHLIQVAVYLKASRIHAAKLECCLLCCWTPQQNNTNTNTNK